MHAYTFRAENAFLPMDYRSSTRLAQHGRAADEQVAYVDAGVDSLFTDHVDVTRQAVGSLTAVLRE